MAMGTPKKPITKKVDPKNTGNDDDDDSELDQPKKKAADDDDDFDGPLDDIGGYDNFDEFDDDDDY